METRTITTLQPSLEEFKRHLRITSNDLDDELTAKLKAAVNMAEHEISAVISVSSFKLTRDFAHSIPLRWPTTAVASVKVDGESALPAEKYSFSESTLTIDSDVNGDKVEVVYTAGLADAPEDIKAAVLLLGANIFNNPVDHPEERDRTSARNLLRPYRSWGERRG